MFCVLSPFFYIAISAFSFFLLNLHHLHFEYSCFHSLFVYSVVYVSPFLCLFLCCIFLSTLSESVLVSFLFCLLVYFFPFFLPFSCLSAFSFSQVFSYVLPLSFSPLPLIFMRVLFLPSIYLSPCVYPLFLPSPSFPYNHFFLLLLRFALTTPKARKNPDARRDGHKPSFPRPFSRASRQAKCRKNCKNSA